MTLISPEVHQELLALVEDLIEATDDHTYWLGPVRDTSLALRDLLTADHTRGAFWCHWECPVNGCRFSSVNPMDHPCPL